MGKYVMFDKAGGITKVGCFDTETLNLLKDESPEGGGVIEVEALFPLMDLEYKVVEGKVVKK